MILSENIKIKINPSNYKYYKSLDYIIKNGQEIEISINHLYKGSHSKIYVKCDVCGKEKYIEYRHYIESSKYGYYSCSPICSKNKSKITCLNKYGNENYNNMEKNKETCLKKYNTEYYFQTVDKKEKTIKTNLEKYGFESHNQSINIKNKKIETYLKNYGVKNYSQSLEFNKKFIDNYFKKNGFLPIYKKLKFIQYRNKINNLTRKTKKILLENWDGYDFYDNEYIKDNFNLKPLDKNYPTIDHKISVFYGYINNISEQDISNIDNLCFTKKSLNSKKYNKCYEEKK